MRKIQDHYFKKAKRENFAARSVYKLEEAQKRFNVIKPGNAVLDLGCHPGSWAQYTASIVGKNGLIVGVDLQDGSDSTLAGGVAFRRLQGDIMDEELPERLAKIRSGFQVVLSDMAPSTSGNKWLDQQMVLRLARRALEIAEKLLYAGGNFYCKVFQGEDVDDFVDRVRQEFTSVKTVKPKSSRAESREMFVLGMGFRKTEGRQGVARDEGRRTRDEKGKQGEWNDGIVE